MKNELKKLQRLVKIQQKEIERLSASVDYDFLTGLYNRQGFIRETKKFLDELAKARKLKENRKAFFGNFSLIFVDVDNLKTINDEYGHKAGDKALKLTAKILQDSMREYDIVARWGGDEFVIGLVGVGEGNALKIAKKLERKIKTTKIKGRPLSASFGVVSAINKKEKILNLYKLIEKADLAMYETKKKKDYGKFIGKREKN